MNYLAIVVSLALRSVVYYAFFMLRITVTFIESLYFKLPCLFLPARVTTYACARVYRVLGRYKFDVMLSPAQARDFITWHDGCHVPSYVLSSHVTLYAVNTREAVFVETARSVHVTSCTEYAFMRLAQFQHAVRVITLPLDAFHELALQVNSESVADDAMTSAQSRCHDHDVTSDQQPDQNNDVMSLQVPLLDATNVTSLTTTANGNRKCTDDAPVEERVLRCQVSEKLIFLSMTGRCGSTLLCQLLHASSDVTAFSEPEVLNTLAQYEGRIPERQLYALIKSCVILLCKPGKRSAGAGHVEEFEGVAVRAYAFKMTPPTVALVPTLLRLFPRSKQLFMYRQGLHVARSSYRVAPQMPLIQLALLNAKLSARRAERVFESIGVASDMLAIVTDSDIAFFYHIWATCVRVYLHCRRDGLAVVGVRYEDLQGDTCAALQRILRYCELPARAHSELSDVIAHIVSRDSQTNSPVSKSAVSRYERAEISARDRRAIEMINSRYELPDIAQPCHLEGTITSS